MMFPKPEKKVKDKTAYSSLQQRKSKPKKEIAPWRQGILSHHADRPSMADRGEFPRKVIEELIAEAGGKCQCCKVNSDTTTHHVQPRGRKTNPGRGVKTNGLRLCWQCHDWIQTNEEELQHWINVHREKYGEFFYFDSQDWEEYERKQSAAKEAEEEQKQRMQELEPVVNLLSLAAGRKLKAAEIRLIDAMDERDMVTFARLMSDIIGTSVRMNEKVEFGYGQFND